MSGTTRPGIWRTVPVDGLLRSWDSMVGGVECDWQRLSKCPRECTAASDYTSVAKATVDLRAAFVSGRGASAGLRRRPACRPRRLRGLLDGRRRAALPRLRDGGRPCRVAGTSSGAPRRRSTTRGSASGPPRASPPSSGSSPPMRRSTTTSATRQRFERWRSSPTSRLTQRSSGGSSARDRTAWEELYAEYQPRLRAFALPARGQRRTTRTTSSRRPSSARCPRSTGSTRTASTSTAYLFATTRNLFLKQVERAKRAEPVAEVPEPDAEACSDRRRSRTQHAPPHRQQEEVRSANAQPRPLASGWCSRCASSTRAGYAEIGVIVGLNENAVAQLISRARDSLRTELRLAPGRSGTAA